MNVKVLLAYDGFEHSRQALEETAELAAEGRSQVTILSVVPEDDAGASKAGGHRMMAPHAHQDVARAHQLLRERGIESEMKIAHGAPLDEIVREAETGGYDLVVVGSRGLGPVGRLILGSVSERLVLRSPVPVLVAGSETTERHEPVAATD
jgi:nucleotide-binding universal stress UspA family protein